MIAKPTWLTLLLQKQMLLILALGFASGLPLGLSSATLQAWFAMEGVDIVTIGFLALAGQPYVYKFMWAPMMDKYRLPFLGLRRGWMLATQIGLILVLVAMALFSPNVHPYHLAVLALCLSFLSASQDIAIDAYRTELLAPFERGLGTAMATSGYRIAMLTSGGLGLIVAHYAGFAATYLLMASLMGIGVIATFWAKEPPHYRKPSPHFLKACIDPFKEFFSRRHAIALLGFIMLYKIGDAFAGSLITAFLLKGVGFTLVDVGIITKTVGVGALLLGAFVGGALMTTLGLYRSLLWFGIIQALTNLLFYALSVVGPHYGLMVLTICLENFGGGLGTTAFMALVMSLCNPAYTATQFALLSAFAAIGRVFVGPIAGYLVDSLGWSEFYLWTVTFAVPGLIVLWCLRDTIGEYSERQAKEMKASSLTQVKANA